MFLGMELAHESLQHFIDTKIASLTEFKIFQIIRQIIEGIYACHKQQIVHFDLKPDNILLFTNDDIKLADFGAAK